MITGRVRRDLGGAEDVVDVIGVNFYDRNEWWNFGKTLRRDEPNYRPFSEILNEVWNRYKRPIFVSETGTENSDRPDWFAYIAGEVRKAMQMGVPVQGICLYPILNHPGWDDNRHCHNGLWDYADEFGHREIYEPLAAEMRRQEEIRKQGELLCRPKN
jgi:beta-glucosidase/6-phospho-beta-glucosidase/beta-galactosidase